MKYISALGLIMSGSMSGVTGSHNRYGQYFRQRTVPVDPSSSRQQEVRAAFSQLAAFWTDVLTQAQRDAWNLYGASVEMIGGLGQTIHLTGFNHYLRSNTVITQATGPRVDPGPTDFTLPTTDPTIAATVSEALQTISLVFDDTLDWCGEDDSFMHVSMASPKSPGVDFIGGPFRFAASIGGNTAVPVTSPKSLIVPFAVALAQKSQVQARITRADGRVSTPFRDTFVVVA